VGRWGFGLMLALMVAGPAAARAQDEAWAPDDGERTAETRTPPAFEGMSYLFPLRLHLTRGGHIDGAMGGYDPDTGEFLLLLPTTTLQLSVSLVDAVTPLGGLPEPDSDAASEPAPPMLSTLHTEYKMRPTWRSGLGLGLSFVMPGLGQFLQEDRKELGFLFLGGAAFFVAGGLLALLAPSSYPPTARRAIGGIMFGFAGTVAIGAGAHAWTSGKRRVEVEVRGARRRSAD